MVPLPGILFYAITFPLQRLAAEQAAWALDLLGVPVLLDGNVIHLSQISLGVTEACSGIRSLISLLAGAVAWAYLMLPAGWLSVLFVALGGPDHDPRQRGARGGHRAHRPVVRRRVRLGLLPRVRRLGRLRLRLRLPHGRLRRSSRLARARRPEAAGMTLSIRAALAAALLLGALAGPAVPLDRRGGADPQDLRHLPVDRRPVAGAQRQQPRARDPEPAQGERLPDAPLRRIRDGRSLWLYIGYWATQRKGAQIHSPRNCLPGGGWEPIEASRLDRAAAGAYAADRGQPLPDPEGPRPAGGTLLVPVAGQGRRRRGGRQDRDGAQRDHPEPDRRSARAGVERRSPAASRRPPTAWSATSRPCTRSWASICPSRHERGHDECRGAHGSAPSSS